MKLLFLVSLCFLLCIIPLETDAATRIGANISTGGSLTVDGALKFTSGATGDYILKTDALGNSAWISVQNALDNATVTADDITEGITNFYYTDAKADARITAQKGFAGGLATLDGLGKLSSGQLPDLAINDTYAVANIAARNALTVQTGDVAIVTDAGAGDSRSYIWAGASWLELLTPLSLYLAKANNLSDIGNAASARSNLGLSNVENTALSTWAGSVNITTLGTISAGTWNGDAIAVTHGGTGLTSVNVGEIIYGSAANTYAALAAGTSGFILKSNGGAAPSWLDVSGWDQNASNDLTSASNLNDLNDVVLGGTAGGDVLWYNGATSRWENLADGNAGEVLTSNGAGGLSWTAVAGGAGDITAVGDVASGNAFTATAGADGNSLYFEGATANGNEVQLTAADPGADVTVTIPATTGILLLNANNLNDVSNTATARGNLGAAASGVNTDITGLTGLNTQNAIQIGPFGVGAGATGEQRFLELAANGADYAAIKSSDALAASYTLTLPTTDGNAGEYLQTDGSGALSWSSPGGAGDITDVGDVASGAAFTQTAAADGNSLYFEGTGAGDTFEVQLTTAANPAADVAVNLPVTAGTLLLNNNNLNDVANTGTARGNLGAAASGANGDITSLTAITSIASSAGLTVTSAAGANNITLDSGTTGTVNVGTGNNAKTVNVGTGNAGNNINIGTNNTVADTIAIGSALDGVTITSTGLNVSAGGALTGVASIDTITTSSTALTFAAGGTLSTTGANNLVLQAGTGNITLGTADTAGTLLVLDTKNDAGNPAGVNGGMYYNSNEGKFKCYEGAAWKDCIQAGGAGDITDVGDIASGAAFTQTAAADGNSLYFEGTGAGDTFEVQLTTAANPAADVAVNLPVTAGTLLLNNNNLNDVANTGTARGNLGAAASGANGDITSLTAVTSIASSAGLTVTSAAGANNITVDSGTTGTVNLGTSNNAKTINMGTGTAGNTINIGTNNTVADTIAIGSALDGLTVSSTGLNVSSGGALTGVASIDTITASATNLTFANAGTVSSTGANAMTVDSGTTGTVNVGTGNNAKTINLGTGTAGDAINIGTDNTTADTIAIGSAKDGLTITSTGLNVSAGGALTGVASIDTITTSSTALTFAAAGTISSTGANNLTLQAGTGNITLGTSDASGTLLVLDTKNDAGNPAGVNGGIYYNSNEGKFKCYENGSWKDCIPAGASGDITDVGDVASGAAFTQTAAADGNSLYFEGTGAGDTFEVQLTTAANPAADVAINLPVTAGTLLLNANNLNDVSNTASARGNLGAAASGANGDITSLTAVTSIASSAGLTVTSAAGANNITVDSGTTGTVNLGTSNNAKTINMGTGTAGNTINIGTNNTVADTIAIGSALDGLTITSTGLNVSSGGALTGVASIDTIAASATALTFAGAGSMTSTGANAMTVDSGTTGAVNVGTGNNAKTVNVGTGTAGNTINIGTNNSVADTIAIGSALDGLTITSTGLNVSSGGALTGVASIDTISTSSTALTFAAGGAISTTGANNLVFRAGTGNITLGTSDTSATLLVLDIKTDAEGALAGTNGGMYYNSNSNKFRCYENGAWKDCDTTGASAAADMQLASSVDNTETLTNVAAVEVTVTSVSITPTTASGDILLRGSVDLMSSNNVDQNLVVNLETTNNCSGTVLATVTFNITSNAATDVGDVELNALITDAGAALKQYSLCASTATGDSDIKTYQLFATVTDNGN